MSGLLPVHVGLIFFNQLDYITRRTLIFDIQKKKHRVTIPCKGLSISHEIRRISWNPYESGGFHEIRRISGEIRRISGEIHPNLIKSEEFLLKHQKSFCSNIWFYKVWVDFTWNPPEFMVKSAGFHGFHEICRISWWNPPDFTDFMKSGRFHEIRRISWWNPADFMVKLAGFHGFHEIRRISWWNPPDFTDFMNVSFWVMIKYRSFYRKTKKTQVAPKLSATLYHWMNTEWTIGIFWDQL